MSKLLIDESPLVFSPSLAKGIGINEAIVLQQLHYLLCKSNNIWKEKLWVYNTYEQWQEKFSFWSIPTIQRIFSSLKKMGLVISQVRTVRKNNNWFSRNVWYTIDYEAMRRFGYHEGEIDEPEKSAIASLSALSISAEHRVDTHTLYIQKNTIQKKKKNIKKKKSCACAIKKTKIVYPDKIEKKEIQQTSKTKKDVSPLPDKKLESFWSKYPRKVAKGAAAKSLQAALKKTSLRSILEALEAQMIERQSCERVGVWVPPWKHPATWLNQECWNDIVRTPDEINKEAQAHWKGKMSYRDVGNMQASVEREARQARIKARMETIE